MKKRLRHQFVAIKATHAVAFGAARDERCRRCGVERSKSKGEPEFRLEGGTWSSVDPGCRDPNQSDLFMPDLSLPEGFAVEGPPIVLENLLSEAQIAAIRATVTEDEARETRQEEISKIFARPVSRADDSAVDLDDLLQIFPGAEIVYVGTERPTDEEAVALSFDPEGPHLGLYEEWRVFALSPRPLPKGLEQIVEGTLGDAVKRTEWMKKALVFRPEAKIVIDGPRKTIELQQHPGNKKTKTFWTVTETEKADEQPRGGLHGERGVDAT